MKKTTKKWLEKTAKANGVTESEVLRYLRNLSRADKVKSHLRLA